MKERGVSKSRTVQAATRRDQLILNHLYLVPPIAAAIRAKLPVHVDSEDLTHEGLCGLVEAARRYDKTRKVPFAVFAKYRIRGAILDGLRRLDPVSRDGRAKAKRLEAAIWNLSNKLGRMPTMTEVTGETGISLQGCGGAAVGHAPGLVHDRTGVPTPSPENLRADESSTTDAMAAREELRKLLVASMRLLPRRDRQILILYHWRGATMRDIGATFRINESRVSQIHKRALERMAQGLRAAGVATSSAILLV